MANMRFAVGRPYVLAEQGDFLAPSAAVSVSDKAGYAKENLLYEHIARAWRSNGSANGAWCGLNVGSSKAYQAILVEGINVRSFTVRAGASATISSNATVRTVSNLTQNPRTKRYSTLAVASGTAQYFGVVSTTGTTVDGTSDLEVGRIVVVSTLRTLAKNWAWPYRRVPDQEGDDLVTPGGSVQSVATSGRYLRFGLQGRFKMTDASQSDDVDRILSIGKDERYLHFENRAADTESLHAYLCAVVGKNHRESYPNLELDVELREVI